MAETFRNRHADIVFLSSCTKTGVACNTAKDEVLTHYVGGLSSALNAGQTDRVIKEQAERGENGRKSEN